jgi:hypothetical protein
MEGGAHDRAFDDGRIYGRVTEVTEDGLVLNDDDGPV